ncbi:MAG: aminotransferase class I/II-fold pyridoxal phosphate-dependent enzyme, partial [Candidatus Binatia bacterium]
MPIAAWIRAWSTRARRASIRTLDYGDAAGSLELRTELTKYLRRARGVTCTPERVVIVTGTQQAIVLTAATLVDPGDRVVLESPHYPAARRAMEAAAAEIAIVPVDEEGIRTDLLDELGAGARLVCVTPSHQFPTGVVLAHRRRLELLAWAHRNSAYVLEDDYASEYRYAERPIEALQGMDREGN